MSKAVGYYVWIPFGDLMHEDAPGPRFQRSQGDPDWWIYRAHIMETYTLKSLQNQTFRDFGIVAGVAEESVKFSKPVADVVKKVGGEIAVHPLRYPDKEGQGAARSSILELLKRHTDAVVIIHLDSDDMYRDDALQEIADRDPDKGRVLYFESGWIWDINSGELREYLPGVCPAPFFSRCYTKDYEKNPDEYDKKYELRNFHWNLSSSPVKMAIGNGRYCVVVHGQNTTTTMKEMGEKKRLGDKASKPSEVLRRFGGLA